MGNHEYCVDCGASDFHHGQTCQEAYPEGYAETQKLRAERAEERKRGRVLLEQFKKKLEDWGLGYVSVNSEDGYDYITVTGFELVRAEKKNKGKAGR